MLKFKTNLLKHQKECVEKLNKYKVGALYMEMGTGKTRTMLEIINKKLCKKKIEKVIWLCPCSTKNNINKELKKHIEKGLDHFVIAGIESLSSSVALNSFLLDYVQKHKCLIVVDESIKIKNFNAIRTKNIIRLGKYCEYRYILNGSPISRDELDLFGQWYFLDWRILGYRSKYAFYDKHVLSIDTSKGIIEKLINTDILMERIEPYTFQVKKEDVIKLPKKHYFSEYFDLEGEHYDHYLSVANYFIDKIDEDIPETIYRMFSHLLNITSGYEYTFKGDQTFKQKRYKNPLNNPRIKELLYCIKKYDAKKIIIFCEFREEINDIITVLSELYGKENVCRFDGSISIKKRNKAIDKFYKEAKFFVANKDCAGYSLNLQFCDTIIYYNNDWDYATRVQSEDRIHRIGQEKETTYVDIIARDTLENQIHDCLRRKMYLVKWFRKTLDGLNKENIIDIAKGGIING